MERTSTSSKRPDMDDKYHVPVKYSQTSRAIGRFVEAVCMYNDRRAVASLNVLSPVKCFESWTWPKLSGAVVTGGV